MRFFLGGGYQLWGNDPTETGIVQSFFFCDPSETFKQQGPLPMADDYNKKLEHCHCLLLML